MTALLSGPLAQAIGWALLHLLWQGVLVAAILAAALALLQNKSANARYLASCGALLVIVAMSVATAYRAYTPVAANVPEIAAPVADSVDSTVAVRSAQPPSPIGQPESAVIDFANAHLSQFLLIWLLGVTVLSGRLLLGWTTAHRLASHYAHDAQEQWQNSMARIAHILRVRRAVRLLESAAVEVPTVVGWLRPAILLPVSSLSGLSLEQIEMILAHELAHIRRHDFAVNLMQSAAETLFFYQPAVWWISRRIRIEREHCCDDIAVAVTGDALRYARALTRFEELRLDRAQTVLAASGGSLVTRIKRLVRAESSEAGWSSQLTAGAALLIVVVTLAIAPSLHAFATDDEQVPKTPPPAAKKATTHEDKSKCTTSGSQVDVEAAVDPDDADTDVDSDDPDQEQTTPPPAVAVVAPTISINTPMPDVDAIVGPIVANVPMVAARAAAAFAPFAQAQAMPALAARRRAHKIDEQHLTVDDLITLRSVGVTTQYIEEMRSAGLGDVSLDDIVAMRSVGVNPDYVKALRDAGVDVKSAEAVIDLRSTGVSPKYISEMAGAGYRNLSATDLMQLRSAGVSPDFVKSLAEAGYPNLSAKDLIRLAASGVNAEFIRDLAKYRTKK